MKRVGALLLESSSGFLHLHTYLCEDMYIDSQEFWWTEGNAGCDCNRTYALYDFKPPDGLSARCGNGRISLVCLSIEGLSE